MRAADNEEQGTTKRMRMKSQKKELEMNGNDAMKWNERIGTEMDKSECDRSD